MQKSAQIIMAYSIRLFDKKKDKEGLIAIWQHGLNQPSLQRYEWLYEYHAIERMNTWLLFHDQEKEPVGCASLLAREFYVNKGKIKVGINCDMIIKQKHRTLGPAIILLKAILEDYQKLGYNLLLAIPNRMSQPVFKRVGYSKIGNVERWSKILYSEIKLKRKVKSIFLRKIAGSIIDYILKLMSAELFVLVLRQKIVNKLKEKNEVLAQFEVNSALENIISAVRTPEYLKWRHFSFKKDANVFSLHDKNSLFGYIVYYFDDKEVIVLEVYLNKYLSNYLVLLALFIRKMRLLKAESISISYFGDKQMQKIFRKLGFMPRDRREVFMHVSSINYEDLFLSKQGWSLFESDLDL